jgi:protein-S-isoprenylcysteine O-methyltransferase Ste14
MRGGPTPAGRPRLPDLGPRGEGWVAGQFILIGLLVVVSLPELAHLWPSSGLGWLGFGVGCAAIVLGGWLLGRASLDLGETLTPMPRPLPAGQLVTTGIYASVRHPIYAGLMVGGLGWSALTRSPAAFVVAILLAAFLDAKARREEAWLLERYEGYAQYRRRSKRFMPGLY